MIPAVLQTQLQLPYDRASWFGAKGLLANLLPGRLEIFTQPNEFLLVSDAQRALATGFRQLGRAVIPAGSHGPERIIALHEVTVAAKVDLLRNRVALRQLVSRGIDEANAHAALAFFVQTKSSNYRLTYAARESVLNLETLSIERRETAPKRFTYILGPGGMRRTATERLTSLATDRSKKTLADITAAFAVESLSKEFFDHYRKHYRAFCEYLLSTDAPKRIFGLKLTGLDDKARDRALKPVRDFVKKLLGRLVFLCFLQKKEWLGCPADRTDWKQGDRDFLHQLFRNAKQPDRFHSQVLTPLFFDTLNNPSRPKFLFSVTGTRVPYLNGGLFERDFTRVAELDFPALLFSALFDFFGQYHFTIDENDPEDHEIGIDPEMLGHIFENLLEDNKDKGAYYTPKAVVHYMARQSLIHALVARFPGDVAAKGEIAAFIRNKDPIDPKSKTWIARHATKLADHLDDLRICDPAIGSGAFPIGLLNEIYWAKLALNPSLDRAEAKRSIIQRSIHGVDLDAGAVEIARLRFWLALVVEEAAPVPLPNLDYQIMQGNSLLESFEGLPLNKLHDLDAPRELGVVVLGSDQVEFGLDSGQRQFVVKAGGASQRALAELRRAYFACHDPEEKSRLRSEIDTAVLHAIDGHLRDAQLRLQRALDHAEDQEKKKRRQLRGYVTPPRELRQRETWIEELAALGEKSTRLHQLLADPRAERPFFLWHLWFRHVLAAPPDGRGGFDIVIANPPYGADLGESNLAELSAASEVAGKRPDSFALFIEHGIKYARDAGVICMIVPNGWYSGTSFGLLRRYFATATNPASFVNLPYDVFSEAWVDTTIFVTSKRAARLSWPRREPLEISAKPFAKRSRLPSVEDFTVGAYVLNFADWFTDGADEFLTFASAPMLAIFRKMQRASVSLGKMADVQRGVTPFELTDKPSHKNSLPALNGTIRRYVYESGPQRFIRYDESLAEFKPHRYFQGPRILLRELISRQFRLQATLVQDDFVTNKSMQSILKLPDCPDLRFILAVLNSTAMSWFFLNRSNIAQRDDFPKIVLDETRSLPIPAANPADQATLTTLVDHILSAKRMGDAAAAETLEAKIDVHVYSLYGLTKDEIALIENRLPKS